MKKSFSRTLSQSRIWDQDCKPQRLQREKRWRAAAGAEGRKTPESGSTEAFNSSTGGGRPWTRSGVSRTSVNLHVKGVRRVPLRPSCRFLGPDQRDAYASARSRHRQRGSIAPPSRDRSCSPDLSFSIILGTRGTLDTRQTAKPDQNHSQTPAAGNDPQHGRHRAMFSVKLKPKPHHVKNKQTKK